MLFTASENWRNGFHAVCWFRIEPDSRRMIRNSVGVETGALGINFEIFFNKNSVVTILVCKMPWNNYLTFVHGVIIK